MGEPLRRNPPPKPSEAALRKLGVSLSTSELDGILRIFDSDGSGSIASWFFFGVNPGGSPGKEHGKWAPENGWDVVGRNTRTFPFGEKNLFSGATLLVSGRVMF